MSAGTADSTQKRAVVPANPFPRYPLHEILDRNSLPPVPSFQRGNRPRDHLWASELGSCQRAVWLNWHHPRPHDDEFEQHRGALGHAVEDIIAKKVARMLVAREVSFNTPKVTGRTDFVLFIDEKQVPLEMKSTYAFSRAMAEPRRSHQLQLLWYTQQLDAPFGLLLYYDLSNYAGNSGHWDVLRLPRDDERVNRRIEHLWYIVHQNHGGPQCEDEKPDECWDCSLAAGRAHDE